MKLELIKLLLLSLLVLNFSGCASGDSDDSIDSEIQNEVIADDDEEFDGDEGEQEISSEDEFDEDSGDSETVAGSESDLDAETSDTNSAAADLEDEFEADFEEDSTATAANEGVDESAFEDADSSIPNTEVAETQEPLLDDEPVVETPVVAEVEEVEEAPAEPELAQVNIKNIRYVSNQSGGTIVVDADQDLTFRKRLNPETQQLVLEIPNANLPKQLKYSYIMKEFPEAPFAGINAYQKGDSTTARVVIQLKPSTAEPLVQQEGSTIVVVPSGLVVASQAQNFSEVKKVVSKDGSIQSLQKISGDKILSANSLDEFLTTNNRFYGRPMSINMQKADVKDAIAFIAEYSGANIIVTDEVKGDVTLKLRNVPWDQALITILRSKSLGYVRSGNVLQISSIAKLKEEADLAQELKKSQKGLAVSQVRVFPISYANVDDLSKQVKPFLSKNGSVITDKRTSAVIVTDVQDKIDQVNILIKELDVPPKQVLIEGKVIEASDTFTKTMGVRWNFGGSLVVSDDGGQNGSPLVLGTTGSISTLAQDRLDALPGQIGLSLGTLDFLGNLDATLALAETNGTAKVISSPRILAMNRERSIISQTGQVISIVSVAAEGITTNTPQRDPVSLSLEVTPQITAAGSVIMAFDLVRQFPGAIVDQTTLARPINTRRANSKVLVPSGQTAVIGGIYQSSENNTTSGIPVLKDVPVLGWLFKSKFREKNKNELLMFLKPRILKSAANS